jgi:WD40 repeat protein
LCGTDSNYGPWFIAFGPGGKSLLAGAGPVWAWDVASGNRLGTFNQTLGAYMIGCGASTPDGKILITGGIGECVIKFWDAATGRPLKILDKNNDSYYGLLTISQDGKTLARWGDPVRVWDLTTSKNTANFRSMAANPVIALTADGKHVAVGGETLEKKPPVLELWDVNANKCVNLEGHREAVNGVVFSADGKQLFSQSPDELRVWDVATGKLIKTLFQKE